MSNIDALVESKVAQAMQDYRVQDQLAHQKLLEQQTESIANLTKRLTSLEYAVRRAISNIEARKLDEAVQDLRNLRMS